MPHLQVPNVQFHKLQTYPSWHMVCVYVRACVSQRLRKGYVAQESTLFQMEFFLRNSN